MLHRRRKLSHALGNASELELSDWSQRGAAQVPRRRTRDPLGPTWQRIVNAASRFEHTTRVYLTQRFARHGSYISRHQTRTLLLCNLVIASLFYPAVVMYLLTTSEDAAVSVTRPCLERHRVQLDTPAACVGGADAPTNIWDVARASLSDVTGGGRVHRSDASYAVHDLRLLWDETPSLEVAEQPSSDADVPSVHMAQVLVTTDAVHGGRGSPYGMLEPHALLGAQHLQHDLEARLRASSVSCVARDGHCLVLSPLSYWPTPEALHADPHPAKSYTGSPARAVVTPPVAPRNTNTTVPLLYSTTLASRWPYLPLFSRAEYLVLTFFLHSTPDVGEMWAQIVGSAARDAHATVSLPEHVARGVTYLRFKPQFLTARPTLNVSVVAGGYMVLLLFIFRGLVQMRRLHSRFGIAFTGSVQLVLDLIMSLSVCALLGIRLTAVPWSILPFIIVVVGSESMLFMIRTITNTPLSLTRHARMAYGLSQVAGPITFTALSDIVLLLLLASTVRIAAVLQFCLFTICTLVVDYFMQMTFFLTVLSIDMQRLELAEVLLQGASNTPAPIPEAAPLVPHEPYRPRSALSLLMRGARAMWHSRSVRSLRFSLVATVVLTTVFYFASDGSASAFLAKLVSLPFSTPSLDPDAAAGALDQSAYGALWSAVNPQHAPLVRILVEPWALVALSAHDLPNTVATPPGPWLESLFFHRRGATLFLIFLFVVCPIAGTMLIMSVVLRYLRKDADLLESQHEKSSGTDAGLNDLLSGRQHTRTSLRVCVSAPTDELHPAPLHLVRADGTWSASIDICNALRVTSPAGTTLCPFAEVRSRARAAPDGARILTAALRAQGDTARLALGQASGRVSVLHIPTWSVLLDATHGPSGLLAPTQEAVWVQDILVTLHRDGQWLAWRNVPHAPADSDWAPGEADAPHAYALQMLAAPAAWTTLPLADSTMLGAVSTQGDIVVVRVETSTRANDTLAATQLLHVQAPALCRCALLFSTDPEESAPRSAPASAMTPSSPPRQAPAKRTRWLVAGDQNGFVHLWREAARVPSTSLALSLPRSDGAVHDMQRLGNASVLLVTTMNRVWFVGVRAAEMKLVLLGSFENARGVAVQLPAPSNSTPWLLGVRRTAYDEHSARWEVWRMRVPAFAADQGSSTLPEMERIPLPLEQLIDASLSARLTDASAEPPSRRPLLAARLDRMVRANPQGSAFLLPFGSCVVKLSVT